MKQHRGVILVLDSPKCSFSQFTQQYCHSLVNKLFMWRNQMREEDVSLHLESFNQFKRLKKMDHRMIEEYYDHHELPCCNRRNWMIVFVKFRGIMLRYASENCRDDFEIVKLAVMNYGNSLRFASVRLQDNDEIVSMALHNSPIALQFASARLRSDFTIVKKAISKCGIAIQYASDNLKNDLEIANAAFDNNLVSLKYLPLTVLNQLALKFVTKNRKCLQYFPFSLLNDYDFMMKVIQAAGSLYYASSELQNDYKFVLAAVSKNGLYLQCASMELQRNSKIISAALAQNKRAQDYLKKNKYY